MTRSRGGPATGRCGTRASEQAGKALRSQGHQCAHVMSQSVSESLPLCKEGTKVCTATHQNMYTWGQDWTGVRASQDHRHSVPTHIPIPGPTLSVADGGGGSNTTHALLSPDPETLLKGEVSHLATGEFLRTKVLQGQPTGAPHAPLTAGPNSSLSPGYGPAIITQELVAENGLFQPKLKLTRKSPKLTPRPDPPEVGTRQLTLCPSSTNSLEPSPNLVPFEIPASGQHG